MLKLTIVGISFDVDIKFEFVSKIDDGTEPRIASIVINKTTDRP